MVKAKLMKKKTNYYPYYERLMKKRLEEPVVEAPEYEVLARRYPHLAKSIKLKRDIKRLEKKRTTLKERTMKLRIEKEILGIKAKLKRENILKKLHGESRREAVFHTYFTIRSFSERIHSLARRISVTSGKTARNIHEVFLSPVFDLKSLDATERSLALREWLHKHHKKPSRKLIASTWPRKKSPMLIAEKVNEAEKNRGSNVA